MKKKMRVFTVMLAAVIGFASTNSWAGGSGGPSKENIQHVIPITVAKKMYCSGGSGRDNDLIMRHYNIRIKYQGQLECDFTSYTEYETNQAICSTTEHSSDDGNHTYELRIENVDPQTAQWTKTWRTQYSWSQGGNPTGISINQNCVVQVSTN